MINDTAIPGLDHYAPPAFYTPRPAKAVESLPLDRMIGITMGFINHAQALMNAAERTIAEQQSRIAALEALATTDELTSIKNRRGFNESFLHELECCKRGTSKGGLLVMIDLDNFKAANDTYGHQAGDAVLKLVAKTLSGEIRATDCVARLGGDEFVLLFANTTKDEASTRAQMIAYQLNNLSLAWYGDLIPVRASVGLKAFGGDDRAENILHSADGTLYAMKAERRTQQESEAPTLK